ncbi:hypothetical protein DPMN_134985 [Dreissena polymorpha]|uniref:Uncharacterized protein n=1 Tax=Dreissena polymorpha TaxID=45954 RepID=A0A9D4JB72_DREPO|nr:hypothetical protein DPMN_134985 [Dreissena polymorpha]
MGVNWPAHQVVVKSTMYYNMGSLKEMSLVLGKQGLKHVRKVSSKMSMCSLHRLIRDDKI